MKKALALCVVLALPAATNWLHAQSPGAADAGLVGTWTLESMEQNVGAPQAGRVGGPRGLLVFDSAGHAFEAVVRGTARAGGPGAGRGAGRGAAPAAAPAAAAPQPASAFSTFAGFWGNYRVDAQKKTVTYRPEGAVSPNMMGREFSRTFEVNGNRLIVTSAPDEPHLQGVTRWTWERVPPVESLGPTYKQVVGFWQHVVEQRVNVATGAVLSETKRAPSIIVYTPSGYVGVHFPPLNRNRFAGTEPTDAEAAEATRGYVGYFGALSVYPQMVFHQVLAGLGFSGSTLKRPLEMSGSGSDVTIKFPPGAAQNGQQTTTWVKLHRLSGEAEMMPKSGK
ncbi:MAG TPA: lipocalin-like domain-containing protein [Vicinamibacterales bacterium]|nr:lipocalin-like domain-containing protein [Vicinamibacterales bacterium]